MLRSLQELSDRNIVVIHEFCNRDVIVVHKLGHTNIVFHEFSDRDVVLFEELVDGGLVDQEVLKGGFEELSDGDIVGLEETSSGSAKELNDGHLEELGCMTGTISDAVSPIVLLEDVVVAEELGDRNVIWLLTQEFRHGDIVLIEELCDGGVQELGHSDIVGLLEEFSH